MCRGRVWLGEQRPRERPVVQALPSCVTACCTADPGCVRSSSHPPPRLSLLSSGWGTSPQPPPRPKEESPPNEGLRPAKPV